MILSLRDVKCYYGLIPALKGISLNVGKGEIVALLGANGAGKTTTLKAIMNDVHKEGVVEFEGRGIEKFRTERIVKFGIAIVPENRQIFPELTVIENLEMGAYTRDDRKKIRSDLTQVFSYFPILKERSQMEGQSLSGGEQQMLAIGRALMSSPKLMLMDEPSLGLGPLIVAHIFEIIKMINAQGTSILLVEQDSNNLVNNLFGEVQINVSNTNCYSLLSQF